MATLNLLNVQWTLFSVSSQKEPKLDQGLLIDWKGKLEVLYFSRDACLCQNHCQKTSSFTERWLKSVFSSPVIEV